MPPPISAVVFDLGGVLAEWELTLTPEAFLDDNALNVEAALATGFQARRAVGVAEVEEVLREFALVD